MRPLVPFAFAAMALAIPFDSHAQTPAAAAAPPQAAGPIDLGAQTGWLWSSHAESPYDDWEGGVAYGGATTGYYWTDHHKTEVEFGASSEAEFYTESRLGSDPALWTYTHHTVSSRTLSLTQHYQFLRNEWFHPFAGAGLAVAWDRETTFTPPRYVYEPINGRPHSRLVVPEQRTGPETGVHARGLAVAGFKAFLNERVYFRSDVQVGFTSRIDRVAFRFGVGVDVGARR